MIFVGDPNLLSDALDCLKTHKQTVGANFKGRFIQIFLGLKYFQNSIPSMYSGSFIGTEVLQSLLDDLYSKASRSANHCVLALFESNFLARTGLIGPGNSSSQNTWRNNLNLQKGIGCYAPAADLSSMTFLDEPRVDCRYLQSAAPNVLAGGKCSLCVSGATYRQEDHRKWLRIDPGGNGYATTDIQNIPNFAPYVTPGGKRIPLLPLIVALYHDADPGLVLGTRTEVSVSEFAADFNFSSAEIAAYFDASITHPLNAKISHSPNWPVGASLGVMTPGNPLIPVATTPATAVMPVQAPVTNQPVLGGTPAPPPLSNNGWDAEQYVAAALGSAGWQAHVVSRQLLGYDIFAKRGVQKRYVEVKSSLGLCSPSLTAREWQQAHHHSASYILAVLENFNPSGINNIHWVPDPAARCSATQQVSVSHGIPRASWSSVTVPIGSI